MTLEQYNSLKDFPSVFKSIWSYGSVDFVLEPGETFIGVRKETIGKDDHSIIDLHGHPHHFTGVEFPDLQAKAENHLEKTIESDTTNPIKYFNTCLN